MPHGQLKVVNAIAEEDEASDEDDLARELKRSRRVKEKKKQRRSYSADNVKIAEIRMV